MGQTVLHSIPLLVRSTVVMANQLFEHNMFSIKLFATHLHDCRYCSDTMSHECENAQLYVVNTNHTRNSCAVADCA